MRRTERVAVELEVTWNRAGRRIGCRALDINAHGMFLSTDYIVEHEALMHVEVQLHDCAISMFVTARYVGRTMRGQGIGAEIFLIDDASRSQWLAFYDKALSAHAAGSAQLSTAATTTADEPNPTRISLQQLLELAAANDGGALGLGFGSASRRDLGGFDEDVKTAPNIVPSALLARHAG
jgi:hypothetical protein